MTQVQAFVFNPFYENTYVVFDEATRQCVIIDPGCFDESEEQMLMAFIQNNQLLPVRLLNTHCHLDHIFGNTFVKRTWGLPLEIHEGEIPVLSNFSNVLRLYGIPMNAPQPEPGPFLVPDQEIRFGETTLRCIFVPGHSPASLAFYCEKSAFVIAGDTLFHESIGRTDLPGGNHKLLLESIKNQLFTLPEETVVYSGHGDATTVGHERKHNPFF